MLRSKVTKVLPKVLLKQAMRKREVVLFFFFLSSYKLFSLIISFAHLAFTTLFSHKTCQFSKQPLVPIGCAATAYFLVSGIKSFQDRDPVKSQRMMKFRVAAQFATLVCFMGYVGWENLDFRLAPMYQDVQKWKKLQEEDEARKQT